MADGRLMWVTTLLVVPVNYLRRTGCFTTKVSLNSNRNSEGNGRKSLICSETMELVSQVLYTHNQNKSKITMVCLFVPVGLIKCKLTVLDFK